MVGNREELLEKTVKEIQWEADEKIAHATHLVREAEIRKRHKGLQDDSGALDDEPRDGDDSGALDDEPRDGAPVRRHHPNFNSRRPADRDRLQNRSRSI
jgi:hypothetical protein